jgi:hypothetical protein
MTQRRQHDFDLTPLFEALERPLALVDSPERRAALEAYIGAARMHLEKAALDLVSGVLEAVNENELGLEARLQYAPGGLKLVIESAAEATASASEGEPLFSIDGDVEKVTIRLPGELKGLIDKAANMRGGSTNSWYIRELSRAIRSSMRDLAREERRAGNRGSRGHSMKGFVGDE